MHLTYTWSCFSPHEVRRRKTKWARNLLKQCYPRPSCLSQGNAVFCIHTQHCTETSIMAYASPRSCLAMGYGSQGDKPQPRHKFPQAPSWMSRKGFHRSLRKTSAFVTYKLRQEKTILFERFCDWVCSTVVFIRPGTRNSAIHFCHNKRNGEL